MKIGIQLYGLSEIRDRFGSPEFLTSQSRVEINLYRGLLQFCASEHSMEVLHPRPWVPLPEDKPFQGGREVNFHRLWSPNLWSRGNSLLIMPLRRYLWNNRHPELIRKLDLDLCHFTWNYPLGKGPLARAEVYSALDFYPQRQNIEGWRQQMKNVGSRYKDLYVSCISDHTAADAVEFLGVKPERVRTVHLAVDHEVYNQIPFPKEDEFVQSKGLKRPYFLYVGALYGRKNQTTLLKALEIFNEKREEPISLVVVGGKGAPAAAEDSKLAQQIDDLKHTDYVHLGMLKDVEMAACYRNAIAHTHAATFEGFGLTILESLASGCPVICGRNSSLPEVGGEAASYVEDVLSVEQWIGALQSFPIEGSRREEMVARGIAQAAKFTWERYGRESAAFTTEILNTLK